MKSARTRQLILEKAATVFNEKGFAGTSMADLEAATGLTRGALYGHFTDKEKLAAETFAWSTSKVKAHINAALDPIDTYKGKLLALLNFFARYVLEPPIPGGCPLLNTAVEVDDTHVVMRGMVSTEIHLMVGAIAILLKKGVRNGEFRKDIDVRGLAYTFFCSIEGAIMFSRVEGSTEPMDIIIRHCKTKLDEITCSKNE